MEEILVDQPKFELVRFYGNWADEMDVQSFTITPKGLLGELLVLSEEYFKTTKEMEIYVGTNEIIYFEKENPKSPYKDTLRNTLIPIEISLEEKETLIKLFDLKENDLSFNTNIIYKLTTILLDTISEADYQAKVYPVIYDYMNKK